MFEDERYMKLYDPEKAYMVNDQVKLLQALDQLKSKNLCCVDSNVLKQYSVWKASQDEEASKRK